MRLMSRNNITTNNHFIRTYLYLIQLPQSYYIINKVNCVSRNKLNKIEACLYLMLFVFFFVYTRFILRINITKKKSLPGCLLWNLIIFQSKVQMLNGRIISLKQDERKQFLFYFLYIFLCLSTFPFSLSKSSIFHTQNESNQGFLYTQPHCTTTA